ncbi:MAG: single-stranded DNA-binding protein [Bacteroidota bacterium]
MVNRVILIGNLGADPEVRTLENGAMVAKIRLATNENYKDKSGEWQSQTEWHDVIAWRNLAERAQSTLSKGAQIYVEGKLTHRLWDDQNGNKRKTSEVVANYFRIINKRDGGSNSSNYFPSEEPASMAASAPPSGDSMPSPKPEQPEPVASSTEAEDDLPF